MLKFKPIFFDSMGAKSMCTLIETGELRVVIDPGIAIMHPSYPVPQEVKEDVYLKGLKNITKTLKKADVVIISHYHHDHYLREDVTLYKSKILLVKNPNTYINDSQRVRAEHFYANLYTRFGGALKEYLEEPVSVEYKDPIEELEIARSRDFKEYNPRRRELLLKGKKWFYTRVKKWNSYKRIREADLEGLKVVFADGLKLELKNLRIKFTKPMFHGVEYSRLGWVIGVVAESGKLKILFTSDINGPIIEDYAYWIIDEKPDIIVLDGPMTYMLGYTLNILNLKRALENAKRIIEESNAELIIYDHHLPRESKFKERTREVWKTAEKLGVKLLTAAEYVGEKPLVLRESLN